MKENKYDDTVFFEKYSQMNRSKQGLCGAGEWETLKSLLPDFKGKKVLDIGCGYGWHCIYAVEQGADSVVGIDISEKMLEVAKEKTQSTKVMYKREAIEDMDFVPETFDIAISSLSLHYVEDFISVVRKVYTFLNPKGSFVFSVEHPVFTSQGLQNWVYGEHGEILHFPVDNYYYEGRRTADFLGENVTKYHKTLTTYLNGLLQNGFRVNNIVEPQPSQHLLETFPGMKDEMRRPMMLIISATKDR